MKFIIVGMHSSGKNEVFNHLLQDDNIRCGRLFSNADLIDPRYEYYTDDDVRDIFENNAYIFIKELESMSKIICYEGLSLHEFDNNDVFVLSPDQINSIPTTNLGNDLCFIWMDCNKEMRRQRYNDEARTYEWIEKERLESTNINDFVNSIYSFPRSRVLYFYNEDPLRVATIIYTLIKYPELISKFEKTFK